MKAKKYISSVFLMLLCSLIFTTATINTGSATEPQSAQTVTNINNYTSALDIIKLPGAYLNKKVVIKARFDKFTTLGLDYKSAMRSSDNYISFMIKREDATHDIPLSEMKLFLKREIAEKHIDLKTNDEISINGIVFSDALGDAWIDVEKITILKKAPETNGVNK